MRIPTPMMHSMNIKLPESGNGNRHSELIQLLIESPFLGPPVELLAPHCHQALDLGQRYAHVPGGIVEFVGEMGL